MSIRFETSQREHLCMKECWSWIESKQHNLIILIITAISDNGLYLMDTSQSGLYPWWPWVFHLQLTATWTNSSMWPFLFPGKNNGQPHGRKIQWLAIFVRARVSPGRNRSVSGLGRDSRILTTATKVLTCRFLRQWARLHKVWSTITLTRTSQEEEKWRSNEWPLLRQQHSLSWF